MRLAVVVLSLVPLGLSACVDGGGFATGEPPSAAQQCLGRTARALSVDRAAITVNQAISYPEGDLVTMTIPGKGRVQCKVDVDGKLGDLVWLEGGPAAPAVVATPAG